MEQADSVAMATLKSIQKSIIEKQPLLQHGLLQHENQGHQMIFVRCKYLEHRNKK